MKKNANILKILPLNNYVLTKEDYITLHRDRFIQIKIIKGKKKGERKKKKGEKKEGKKERRKEEKRKEKRK